MRWLLIFLGVFTFSMLSFAETVVVSCEEYDDKDQWVEVKVTQGVESTYFMAVLKHNYDNKVSTIVSEALVYKVDCNGRACYQDKAHTIKLTASDADFARADFSMILDGPGSLSILGMVCYE